MELVLYAIISWLVITYLFTTIQKIEVIRSIIMYSIVAILTVSSFTIISLNLKLIYITEDRTKFLSLLMSRNIIIPFLIIIFVNLFYRLTSYKKIVPIISLILLITLLEFINLKLQIYSYVQWNFALTFLINSLFVLTALILSKCINIIQLRSEHK